MVGVTVIIILWSIILYCNAVVDDHCTRHCLYLLANIGGLLLSSPLSQSDFLTHSHTREEGEGGGGRGGEGEGGG